MTVYTIIIAPRVAYKNRPRHLGDKHLSRLLITVCLFLLAISLLCSYRFLFSFLCIAYTALRLYNYYNKKPCMYIRAKYACVYAGLLCSQLQVSTNGWLYIIVHLVIIICTVFISYTDCHTVVVLTTEMGSLEPLVVEAFFDIIFLRYHAAPERTTGGRRADTTAGKPSGCKCSIMIM